ncbi:unnamed protein product [Eruca vesicaria subsp. sativa]|uniref:Uncharacterized protein n=1 Tax=Eruca vesicaria subsp. sativa TaxID=29727 RepID=A0ABC8M705_ERUVS|nr:unnamed protein product [Eruca vesicaria subsp. sativa]
MEFAKSNMNGTQNVIVMRHGDRADRCEPLWVSTAERPWDPPLVHDGKVRAFQTGQRIRSQVGFPIHRVIVSPFLRCIQTAAEVVAALSAVNLDHNAMSSKDVPAIDNSKLKVVIEFGLCEILNTVAIKSEVAPKDGDFDFKISDLQAMFPEGTFDINVDMACKELPQWGESSEGFKERYINTLKVLADKYPSENLLLVTHWGGVGTILYKYFKDATKYLVDYCGCVELRRQVSKNNESEEFQVVTSHGVAFKDNKVTRPTLIRATMESSANSNTTVTYQNILMMRHGDRIDQVNPLWLDTAARPWDPPLVHDGMVRAFRTGQRLRSRIQFPIHRVVVSPFIRCVQTASEVVNALSAIDLDPNATSSKDVLSIDKSKLKVSIEFGLSEMLNTISIKPEIAPRDRKFEFLISDLEAMFPEGMVDHNAIPAYKEIPQWGETIQECTDRFLSVLNTLADQYPSENLLLVTHAEGVRTTFATYKEVDVYDIEYCACAELRRQVLSQEGSTKAGRFEVITSLGEAGIKYHMTTTSHL